MSIGTYALGCTWASSSGVFADRAGAEFDDGAPRTDLIADGGGVLGQQGGFRAGGIVFRQPGDRLEQLRPGLVVEEPRRDAADGCRQTVQHGAREGSHLGIGLPVRWITRAGVELTAGSCAQAPEPDVSAIWATAREDPVPRRRSRLRFVAQPVAFSEGGTTREQIKMGAIRGRAPLGECLTPIGGLLTERPLWTGRPRSTLLHLARSEQNPMGQYRLRAQAHPPDRKAHRAEPGPQVAHAHLRQEGRAVATRRRQQGRGGGSLQGGAARDAACGIGKGVIHRNTVARQAVASVQAHQGAEGKRAAGNLIGS